MAVRVWPGETDSGEFEELIKQETQYFIFNAPICKIDLSVAKICWGHLDLKLSFYLFCFFRFLLRFLHFLWFSSSKSNSFLIRRNITYLDDFFCIVFVSFNIQVASIRLI